MKTTDLTSNILDFFSTELYLPIDEPYIMYATNPGKSYNLKDLLEQIVIPKLQEQKYLAIYINSDDLDIFIESSTSHEKFISDFGFTPEDLEFIHTLNIGDLSIDFALD